MQKKVFSRYAPVDCLYVCLLLVSVAAGGTAAVAVLQEEECLSLLVESDILAVYGQIGAGLAPIAASLLVWRVWLSSRYRACPPVDNALLPFMTVVVPAYNEGAQVFATIRSVMASDYPPDKMRLICVDDGSKDDTWDWLVRGAEAFPGRVQLVRQPRNLGKRHALLAGFRQAEDSNVFVTLDSDSEILPDTLRQLVSPLASDPRVGAVAGSVRVLNLKEGPIPKMLEVAFSLSFDFLRRGQSVYGGVLCTPGALSAYRTAAILPELDAWADQRFLGRTAAIGEDRALSNLVLRQGRRVVFQKNAVVLTKVPVSYRGLYRMLLRWARSNVRESLVMALYLYKNFRPRDSGAGWMRLGASVDLLFLPLAEMLKIGFFLGIVAHPLVSLPALGTSCLVAAILPATVFQFRRRGAFGCIWAVAYTSFWASCLSWISGWGLLSAGCSGWLTRGASARLPVALPVKKEHSQAV